jgi:hypothetical protein
MRRVRPSVAGGPGAGSTGSSRPAGCDTFAPSGVYPLRRRGRACGVVRRRGPRRCGPWGPRGHRRNGGTSSMDTRTTSTGSTTPTGGADLSRREVGGPPRRRGTGRAPPGRRQAPNGPRGPRRLAGRHPDRGGRHDGPTDGQRPAGRGAGAGALAAPHHPRAGGGGAGPQPPGALVIFVEAGTWGYTALGGTALLTRAGAAATPAAGAAPGEQLPVGEEVVLTAGDWLFVEDPRTTSATPGRTTWCC